MFKELERQKVDQQILSTKAANWRCKATKVMVYGDLEPNYLYSSNIFLGKPIKKLRIKI